MRVLQLTQRYPPALGGVEDHVQRLSRGLVRSGIEVEVSTTDLARDRPFRRFERPPIDGGSPPIRRRRAVRWIRARHGLGIAAPGLLADVLATRSDVVHAHAFGYFPSWIAVLARRFGRRPLVVTTHMDRRGPPGSPSPAALLVATATLRPADRVIALTGHEAGYLRELGVPAERIVVIPNGIDLAEFGPPVGPPTRDPRTVLYVGRIYPEQKGLDVLVEAFASKGPELDLRLRFVGEDWGGTASLTAQAARAGIADRVTFLGPLSRADLLAEYRRAGLFVLPSRFEPFGIVLLEAMASGVPIVASRVGGIPEVVQDGRSGILVPPEDPQALAGAIGRLVQNPELSLGLADAARTHVEGFDWSRLLPRFIELYRELVDAIPKNSN